MTLIEVLRLLTSGPAAHSRARRSAGWRIGGAGRSGRVRSRRAVADQDRRFRSKSKNAPFDGRPVQGRVERTIVDGRTIFARP